MSFFSDVVGESVATSLTDYGGMALGYTYGIYGTIAYEAYKMYANKDNGDSGPNATGKSEQDLIKEMAASESEAGQEAMYLRKQAMINNVL